MKRLIRPQWIISGLYIFSLVFIATLLNSFVIGELNFNKDFWQNLPSLLGFSSIIAVLFTLGYALWKMKNKNDR